MFSPPEKNISVEHTGPEVKPQCSQSYQECTGRLNAFFLVEIRIILIL